MPCVRTSSIPTPLRPDQPAFNRALRRWLGAELRQLRPVLAQSAAACQADRYCKHFDSFAHACLLLHHGCSGKPSIRQSFAAFGVASGLVQLAGLDRDPERLGVSFSQFAHANSTRPAAFLLGLIPPLARRVRQAGHATALPLDLRLLDSTFLQLSAKLAPWVTPSQHRIQLQVSYTPALDLPDELWITGRHGSDYQGMDRLLLQQPAALARLRGCTLVFDLGYYSHARFAQLLDAGIHLVTRRHAQACLEVLEERPLQPALPGLPGKSRIQVQHDQRVRVGSLTNHTTPRLLELRLVTALVEPTAKAKRRGAMPIIYEVLTDRWDLSAAEVVQCYLWRWEIELFFRWLKSHIHIPHILGYSENAVLLSVYLAIIVHLLGVLAAHAVGHLRRFPTLLSQLGALLAQLQPADLCCLSFGPHQLTFPDCRSPDRW